MAKRSKIIGLWSLKGGTGKSTLALSIAGGLAQRGYRVQLFDTDPQRTSAFIAGTGGVGRRDGLSYRVITDIADLDSDMDYIVVDYPPAMEGRDINGSNDVVVIPFNATLHDYHAASSGISTLAAAEKKILVLNNYNRNRIDQHDLWLELMEKNPEMMVIPEIEEFRKAMNRNTTVYNRAGDCEGQRRARAAVDFLIDAILEKLGD